MTSTIVLMGVAGAGKTTVGRALAARLGVDFVDADDLHTDDTRAQMAGGVPLNDAQRDEWMTRVLQALRDHPGAVVACSALRRRHRDSMARVGDVRFFLLDVPAHDLGERLARRTGHFFPERLLDAQLETFEPPTPDEGVRVVDADKPVDEIVDAICATGT